MAGLGFAALVLNACGGANPTAPIATEKALASTIPVAVALNAVPSELRVQVDGCSQATVRDSGQLLYVVLPLSCSSVPAEVLVFVGMASSGAGFTAGALALTRTAGAVDSTTVAINGLGERQVHVVRQGQWRELAHQGTWKGRDGAGLLQLHGALYMLGGWLYGEVTNEVWRTTDLMHWQFLGYAPWPARHGAGWLVHNNRLWVVGGDLYTDVWSSSDGVVWTQETAQASFDARYTPNVASINGELVLYGGQDWLPHAWCHERSDCQARAARSVWKSTDGKRWTLALEQTPFAGRALVHGAAVWGGEVYVIGGGLKVAPPFQRYTETSVEYTDVWSSADGVSWTLRAQSMGFAARTHFSVLSTEQGCYVSDGSVGFQDKLSNDFFFAPDCVHFKALTVPEKMPVRHASSLAEFNGSLVLLGGPPYGNAGTSVWQYFP